MDDRVKLSALKSIQEAESSIATTEKHCIANNTISVNDFTTLKNYREIIGVYASIIGYTVKPIQLPSELNEFTQVAYLAILKEKHGHTNRRTETNTKDS